MFFSILLPTKNGNDYIDSAIKSVLDQDFKDYELIIGDNCNNHNFRMRISRFARDKRIKIIRPSFPLNVTQNWNYCLSRAKGRYIIMLGDDDCILKDGLKKIYKNLVLLNFPDCLSVNGISFFHKGSFKDKHKAYYKNNYFNYSFVEPKNKFFLNKDFKNKIIEEIFSFNNLLPLNMQPHIVSRQTVLRMKRNFFLEPFPDHYAIHSMLLSNVNWWVCNEKIFGIGISKKSFGNLFYSERYLQSFKYLGLNLDEKETIRGSILYNAQYIWLRKLKNNFSNELLNIKINYKNYLMRQLIFNFIYCIKKRTIKKFLIIFFSLKLKDFLNLFKSLFDKRLATLFLKKIFISLFISNVPIVINNNDDIYVFTRRYKNKLE